MNFLSKGFGFIEFEDSRDAEEAVRNLDGNTLNGNQLKVEMSNGKKRPRRDNRDDRYPSNRWQNNRFVTKES